jgi:hypothetical protein
LATADVPMTAKIATTIADGIVVWSGGLEKTILPPKTPTKSTAIHITLMVTEAVLLAFIGAKR